MLTSASAFLFTLPLYESLLFTAIIGHSARSWASQVSGFA
jgi:hypothetical protein